MKKYFILIITLTTLIACKKKIEETSTTKGDIIEDTLQKTEHSDEKIDVEKTKQKVQLYHNEAFETFLNQFGTDSIFQKERIKYPLAYIYYDHDSLGNFKPNLISVSRDEYLYRDFTGDKKPANTIEITKPSDTIYYTLKVNNSGMTIHYKFLFLKDKYHLVEIKDKSI